MSDLILTKTLPADQHPVAVYMKSLSEGGQRSAMQSLAVIAALVGATDVQSLDWGALRFQHTAAIRSALVDLTNGETGKKVYKYTTVNKHLAALRSTLKQAWKLGQMTAEEYHLAVSVDNVKGESVPTGRSLSGGEIAALMGVCEIDPTPAGVRDAAIIAIAYGCGLRRSEMVALDLTDYDPESGQLVVHGKGNKERESFILNGGGRALAAWLAIRGDFPGPLFCPIHKGGKISHRGMTTNAIYNMLEKRGEQAKLKKFSPHDLRRTIAGDMLDLGIDLVTVQNILGHADPKTTARYDRRGSRRKKAAANSIHIPYGGGE